MNIFITDECPTACAATLADQHVVSQTGETARILVTALHRRGISGPLFGKPYNPGGRFAKWAAEDWHHFMWLSFHGMALAEEHDHRFDKVHKSTSEIIAAGQLGYLMMDSDPHVPFRWPRCEAAKKYIEGHGLDVFHAYANVLRDKYATWTQTGGRKVPKWTNTSPPDWLAETTDEYLLR
jgi:hypothetical protein